MCNHRISECLPACLMRHFIGIPIDKKHMRWWIKLHSFVHSCSIGISSKLRDEKREKMFFHWFSIKESLALYSAVQQIVFKRKKEKNWMKINDDAPSFAQCSPSSYQTSIHRLCKLRIHGMLLCAKKKMKEDERRETFSFVLTWGNKQENFLHHSMSIINHKKIIVVGWLWGARRWRKNLIHEPKITKLLLPRMDNHDCKSQDAAKNSPFFNKWEDEEEEEATDMIHEETFEKY